MPQKFYSEHETLEIINLQGCNELSAEGTKAGVS